MENLACPDISKAHRMFGYYRLLSTWMFLCYFMFVFVVVGLFLCNFMKVSLYVRFVSNLFRCFLPSV